MNRRGEWSGWEIPSPSYVLLAIFRQKAKLKKKKKNWINFWGFQLPEVREKKGKSADWYICFQIVARNNFFVLFYFILVSYVVHSQIWLNLPRVDRRISFHLPMDDRHLGSIKKIPQKTPTPVPTETKPSSFLQTVCVPRDNPYFYGLMRSTHASDGWYRTPGLRPGSMRAVRHCVVRRTRRPGCRLIIG
jgi:hypothetical protein